MRQRNRGRSLSADDLTAVRTELSTRSWNNQLLADYTALSLSTIKRMLKGKPVDLSSIKATLEFLGLSVDPYLNKIQLVPSATTLALEPSLISSVEIVEATPNTLPSFYMNATYSNTKIPQIKCVLAALKQQLVDSEVILDVSENRLTVSGVFTPETRSDIEATIRHLERLFISCQLTGDITCETNRQPLLAMATAN